MQCSYHGMTGQCRDEAVFEFRNDGDVSGQVHVGACPSHLGLMLDPSKTTEVYAAGCGWAETWRDRGFAGQPVRYGNMTVRR